MKISVVIPAYNAESYIARTLNSIKVQTYPNYEIIVVNDGSSDHTKALVETFINDNESLDIKLINIRNGGLANARNIGLEKCTGDLFLNLDADDYLEANTFELAIKTFEQYDDLDICFYGYKSFEKDNDFFDYYEETKKWLDMPLTGIEAFKLRIKRIIWICQGSAIYKMKLIKENSILNKPGFNQGEDMYFISKCLLLAKKVYCFKADCFCCMNRRDSMNNSSYNESFFEVNQLLLMLKNEMKQQDFYNEVSYYVDLEYVSQYLAIVKRAARHFRLKDYLDNFARIPFSLESVNIKKLKSDMSKIKKIEIKTFRISKVVYYYFVRLYDKGGLK